MGRNSIAARDRWPYGGRPPRGGVGRNWRSRTVRSIPSVSPPTRGRGSKQGDLRLPVARIEVAPHAGAWVETKLRNLRQLVVVVAPHAGAWVETRWAGDARSPTSVAPHAEAWVETFGFLTPARVVSRRPPRGGVGRNSTASLAWSFAGCHPPARLAPPCSRSPPTRARGLKRICPELRAARKVVRK